MNASATTLRRLRTATVAAAVVAALVAPAALADPPGYPRHVSGSQFAAVHVPEIVAGIAPSPEGRPSPRPEITTGIAVPSGTLLTAWPQPDSTATSDGFNWADAGIGAGIALAAAGLAVGCALALRKRVSLAH